MIKVPTMPMERDQGRGTCPGCKMAIYDLAAAEGWCTDCNPKERARWLVEHLPTHLAATDDQIRMMYQICKDLIRCPGD